MFGTIKALALSAGLTLFAGVTAAQTPPAPVASAWQPKTQVEFEAAVRKAVEEALAAKAVAPSAALNAVQPALQSTIANGVQAATPAVLSSQDAFKVAVRDAVLAASESIDAKRRSVFVLPTGDCGRYAAEPAVNLTGRDMMGDKARNVEQRATRDIACCLDDPDHADRMACIHRNVGWLAYSHSRQARAGQKVFFGESALSAGTAFVGAADVAISGVSSRTGAWYGVGMFAPIILEDLMASGPRSQVHYAASHAFEQLASHYRTLDRHFGSFDKVLEEKQATEIYQNCRTIEGQKAVEDKAQEADAAIFNADIERFKTYCKDFVDTFVSARSYRAGLMVAYDDLAEKYARDAVAIEGIFHKMSFKLQTPPSRAVQIAAAAPFQAVANALKEGKSLEDYKTQQVTFDLEKDGIPLSGTWPASTATFKPFPLVGVTRTKSGKASETKLLLGNAANEVKTASDLMAAIAAESAADSLFEVNDRINRTVSALADHVGTYKMVFDMRSEKRTADIEFTRASDKK